MRRKLFAAGAVLAFVVVAALAYAYRDSQPGLFVRLAPGRAVQCPLGSVWSAVGAHRALWERIYDVSEEFEKLQSDAGCCDLIQSGERRWWIPRRNQVALAEMMAEQEAEVYGAAGRGVHPGDVVLDCGANVGVYTRHALDAGARTVVAIEPAPENIECLQRNFAGEIKTGRVILYPKGVWDTEEEIRIRTYGNESGGNSVALQFPGSSEGPKVQLTTIDKMMAELRLDRVDFIKMDIEGSERKALAGASETVSRFHPRMAISLEHQPDDYEAIGAVIGKLWPEMKTSCGPCRFVSTALVSRIQPEELYVSR
jgi:FkbM family methyltransferase